MFKKPKPVNGQYYLGVESLGRAYDAIDELTFCRVSKRKTHDEIANHPKDDVGVVGTDMNVRFIVSQVPGEQEVIIFLAGTFTAREVEEIERLRKYEYKPIRSTVAQVAASMTAGFQKAGYRTTKPPTILTSD